MHLPTAPPQFSSMEEMNVGSSRAKRYSSQRQRAVPEPAPPMHLGVMEGHYYEPSKNLLGRGDGGWGPQLVHQFKKYETRLMYLQNDGTR